MRSLSAAHPECSRRRGCRERAADIGAFSISSDSADIGKPALIHAGAIHSGADSRSGIGAGTLGSSTVVATVL